MTGKAIASRPSPLFNPAEAMGEDDIPTGTAPEPHPVQRRATTKRDAAPVATEREVVPGEAEKVTSSPTMNPAWAEVEAALVRVFWERGNIQDHATIAAAGLIGDTLKREMFRIGQVERHRVNAGSMRRLAELKQRALDVSDHKNAERVELQKSLAEKLAEAERVANSIRQQIEAVDREVTDAAAAVATMETANAELRGLVPAYLKSFHQAIVSEFTIRLRRPLESLRVNIAACVAIRDVNPKETSGSVIDRWKDALKAVQRLGLDRETGFYWFNAAIKNYGLQIQLNDEFMLFLKTVKAKVAAGWLMSGVFDRPQRCM